MLSGYLRADLKSGVSGVSVSFLGGNVVATLQRSEGPYPEFGSCVEKLIRPPAYQERLRRLPLTK